MYFFAFYVKIVIIIIIVVVIIIIIQHYLNDKIKYVACSKYGGEERYIQGFDGETGGKETTWKTQA
jgi:uncharacterized protein YxeA